MDIYDLIVDGLKELHNTASIESHLKGLQKYVKTLRKAYCSYPVNVPYNEEKIQEAYILTYLPHYYQLIYSILNIEKGLLFQNKAKVCLGFIGGGPGSEAYGAMKYIINNCPQIKEVDIVVFDINAETWQYGHQIVLNSLIKKIKGCESLNINWKAICFDLTNENDVYSNDSIFKNLDLLVIQNCINEIQIKYVPTLRKVLLTVYNLLPSDSYFLISDLTASVRDLMLKVENDIETKSKIKYKLSTLGQTEPVQMISVHSKPNQTVRENLLNGTDGLIPRKNLKYDYTLLARPKVVNKKKDRKEVIGFQALYAPLEYSHIDANNYVHSKIFIGLDFGTSTTVLSYAILENDKLEVKSIKIPQKNNLGNITQVSIVPTVMGLHNNRFMVGKFAEERKGMLELGKDIWYGFKENLNKLEEIIYPRSVLKTHDKVKISNAKEALVYFFTYLRTECEKYLAANHLPTEMEFSVTVPANFEFEKKQKLRECLLAAGIEYETAPFIEEPTAALINYLYESKDPISIKEIPKNVLILDIGAGTVDVSIMQLSMQLEGANSKLLAVARQGDVGGNLLDEMVAIKLLGNQASFDKSTLSEKKEILKCCENLKIKLCGEVVTDSSVGYQLSSLAFGANQITIPAVNSLAKKGLPTAALKFSDFYSIMREYWDYTESTINKALSIAGLNKETIDLVILNGGGCRNPYILNFAKIFLAQL